MEATSSIVPTVLGGGFALAFIFGALASKTNFCTMGAISDIVNMGHWGRMRMWLLAIAVAIAGATALQLLRWVDLSQSIYLRPRLAWFSHLVGGLVFGVGMTLAGGCANKNLLRLGGGSLRSLVVLTFLAISAYMTMKGLFGQWRVSLLDPVAMDLTGVGLKDQGLASLLSKGSGLVPRTALLLSAGGLVAGLLAFVLKDRRFRQNTWQLTGGVVLGLIVVAGWYLTGHIGYGEHPQTMEMTYLGTNSRTLESMSFVAPVAYSLELLMLWTDKSLLPSFGIATVLGVAVGSLAHALSAGTFRWEGFASNADLRTQLIGAVLMGFGGVTATGCTVGQGLSGLSTLALGSFIAVAGIVIGSAGTLKYIVWRESRD